MKKLIIVTLLVLSFANATPTKQVTIIPLTESPLEITKFDASFNSSNDTILVNVAIKNNSKSDLQAVGIGFLFYNPFNEFIDGFTGISMIRGDFNQQGAVKPGDTYEASWSSRYGSNFAVSTFLAFPSKARFADGTIWKADEGELGARLKQLLGVNFDPSKLK